MGNSAPPVFLPTVSAPHILGELLRNNCDVPLFSPQHVEGPERQLHGQLRIHAFTSCVTQRTQVRLVCLCLCVAVISIVVVWLQSCSFFALRFVETFMIKVMLN